MNKTQTSLAPGARRDSRGIALILVLAGLVLITVLLLGFLGSIGTELQSSKVYANGSSVKLLAQSTVDLVEAEIRDATSDGTLCWASQPGMIRTYDNTGATKQYYKLYSDSNMIGSGVFDHTQTLVPDGTSGTVAWYNQQGVYVDLNQPVYVNGANQYPILDGDSSDLAAFTFAAGSGGNTTTPLPPLMLPAAATTAKVYGPLNAGQPAVAGFWLNSNTPAAPSSPNQAPMPVKWLYVLQDGTVAVPDTASSASTTVTFTNSTVKPTATNPLIGRMAFWTDDETSKININTASEGTYWDIPRENSPADVTLAQNAPVLYEFQRYPGHPATTSLSTVFNLTTPETIYSIAPRLSPGGSQEGTVQTTQGASYTTPVPNANRLYSTTDEFLFQGSLSGSSRVQNSTLSGASALTPAALKEARFFITTSSRAPDVNLFNRPRISIWPISANQNSGTTTYRSIYDQLISFCTTMRTDLSAPYLYYFQRKDPTDPNTDLPTANDNAGLDRNRRLLEYLRNFTAQNIPGFGGNFAAKYNTSNGNGGTDRDQILTEIFDYIRSTNLLDPSVTNDYTYQLSPSLVNTVPYASAGLGQVIPIVDSTNKTRGFGRFRTVQGGTMLFIANADGDSPNSQPQTNPVASGYMRIQMAFIPQLFDPSVGSVFDVNSFDITVTGLDGLTAGGLSLGFPASVTEHLASASYDGAAWGDQYGLRSSLGSTSASPFISASIDIPKASGTFAFASSSPIHIQLQTPTAGAIPPGATHPGTVVQDVALNFPGGTFPLPALAPSNVYDQPSATGPFNMRYFFMPPALQNPNTISGPDLPGNNSPSVGGRMAATNGSDPYAWITSYDVVRSVAAPADIRLIAAQQTPPAPTSTKYLFAPVGNYSSSTAFSSGMHTLFTAAGVPYWGAVWGQLVSGVSYDGQGSPGVSSFNPLVYAAAAPGQPGGTAPNPNNFDFADVFNPSTGHWLNGVSMGKTTPYTAGDVVGDWDNGVANLRDGPFINKADEGDMGTTTIKPYFKWKSRTGTSNLNTGLFTPSRMIASAVMFGSLPTGVLANHPWQTLLFRAGPIGHAGLGTSATLYASASMAGSDQGPPYTTVPDHLLLDLFTMPVVEPYAISEPLSTAGRINMNYLIVPFNYINRDTGLRAVLKSEQVVSLSDTQASGYKLAYSTANQTACHFPVNMDATLSQFFARRFNNKDIFRSPSEICDIDIVPNDSSRPSTENPFAAPSTAPTRAQMDTYWTSTTAGHRLTGDNSRERIYATIYPRLTTKSNTFTVHFRVQTLKPVTTPGSDPTKWSEGTGLVTGEYRGSETIERYVDPNDSTLPDFADPANYSDTLAPYYKFRVVSNKQFAP